MPKTDYISDLDGEQIEAALEAIHDVVTPSNNGKVLCIVGGKIAAKSASEWGGGGYPEPTGTVQITQNGTVNVKDYASAEVNVPTGITAADEGKVVKNGALVAQTARATEITANGTYDTTENNSVTVNVSGGGGGGAVVQPLSVTQNGTYNPPSGVDGYAPVTVNVSGGGSPIHSISVISSSSIFTEFQCDSDIQLPSNLKNYENALAQYFGTSSSRILYSEMAEANTSATIYAVIKSLINSGVFAGVCFAYDTSRENFPLLYTRNEVWQGGTYSNDFNTGISSNVFRVLALAVDNSTKIARFFIDDTKMSTEKQFSNSGKCAGWGGGITNTGTIVLASTFDVRYGALVQGVETDAEILANMALISTQYAGILGT